MKNIFLKVIFCFSVMILSLLIPSCSQKDEPIITDNSDEDSDTISLTFQAIVDNITTKCHGSHGDYDFGDAFTDKCQLNGAIYNFILLLYIDGQNVLATDLNPDNIDENQYLSNVRKYDDKSVSFTLSFLKNIDPSKITIICLASKYWGTSSLGRSSYVGFQNYDSEITNLKFLFNSSGENCHFFKKHILSETGDWNNVTQFIELKRMSSEIIILTKKRDYGLGNIYFDNSDVRLQDSESNLYTVLNYQNSILNIPHIDFDNNTLYLGADDCFKQSLSIEDDKVYFYDMSYLGREESIGIKQPNKTVSYLIGSTVNYNGLEYYYFFPLCFLSTQFASIPQLETGEYINNIQLIYRKGEKIPYDTYWTNIPIHEGGFKANTRYIYILSDSYPMWQNHINFATRSSQPTLSESDYISTDFEIIEQSMDEPLPFEVIKNNQL